MAPVHVIFSMVIIQVAAYILLDKYKLSKWNYLVLGISMVLNLFIFPDYFISENRIEGSRCGMPALAITFAFWIFGGISTIITLPIYIILKRLIRTA